MEIQSLRTSDCIDEVIEKYADMVYQLALTHMKTKQDAEDVLQDVFLKYISKPHTFKSEEHRKAWLIRVTINRCNSLWKRLSLHKSESLEDNVIGNTPEQHLEYNDLSQCLSRLPRKHRFAVYLFYYEDLSIKQISEIMNSKESTVRTWLTRARSALKEELKGEFSNGLEVL